MECWSWNLKIFRINLEFKGIVEFLRFINLESGVFPFELARIGIIVDVKCGKRGRWQIANIIGTLEIILFQRLDVQNI